MYNIWDFMKDHGVWIATVVAALIAGVFGLLGGKTSNIVGGREVERLNRRITEWIVGMSVIILLIFLYMPVSILIDKYILKETTVERNEATFNSQDITGNYLVRMMNGSENVNAAIKIYKKGSEYAMNVYSSSITKKFTFSYNPSSGVLLSKELGAGEVKIKGLTNEIEITFEGWKLVK